MRVLLAFSLFSLSLAADRAMNIPCNRELDGLLAVDPDGNSSAFLSCRVTGDGNIGIWERNFCPYNMIFDFINQQCKTVAMRKQHRKPQSNLNIAILNSSCAKGETCIGGTVCDRDTLRCLCPFGTIPQLETLSCVKNENAFNPERFKFSFENVNKNGNFLPNPNQPINMNNNNGQPGFIPNPNFNKFNPNNYNSNNFANNNNLGNSQWQTNSPATSSNNFGGMMPNHKFVFGNFGGVTTQAPTTKRIPILAEPGQSCRSKEVCMGGSICTLPIGLCLCPGDLEARDGECVLPATSSIKIQKVGIGAICNDLAECDNGSVCQMGRCACVSPLVQYEGKCVLRQERKEVGPGELCDNGEVCVKGSICDSIIPVCVCPSDTDLSNGECVHVYKPNGATKSTYSESTVPPTLAPIQTTARPVATAAPVYIPATTTKTIPPVYTFNQNIVQQPSTTYGYKNVATQQPTSKPNHMKISLGGSKQSGVGVRCSLNTDCMIGAYCNGNTSPPSCQCLSTHVNIESRCEKVIYPGQIGCRSSQQCTAAYAGTSCVDRVCKCPDGTKTVDQTCIPELDLCIPACVPPLICSYNICICPDETNCQTQLMLIGKKKISNLDSVESRTNMQTISFHKRSRRQTNGLVCWPDATTCSDGHGVCISNKCHCINGLVPRDGFCRPVLLPVDSSCDVENLSAVCEDGAFCIDGFCRCQKPGGCLMSVSMCESHSQCPQTFICVGGRCVCDTNFVVKNGQCHPTSQNDVLIYKGINNICNIKTDRCSGGSVCKGGVCICTDDSVEKMGRCHQNPGGRCSNGQTCVNGSICELGRCNCPDGHVISTRDPTMCIVAASEAGKSCQLGEVCIHGSVCRFGICMCVAKKVNVNGRCVKKDSIPIKVNKIPTTTPTPSTTLKTTTSLPPSTVTTTLPVTTYISESTISSFNSNCTLFEICNGSSSCAGEICPCKDNEIVVDEKCVGDMELMPISAPGQPCNAETTCTGGSICINELCRCESGVLNAQGFCELPSTPPSLNPTETPLKVHTSGQKAKKSSSSSDELLPGMECLLTVQCPFRTECRQGVCRCRHGETIVDGTCRQAIHQVRVGGACNPQKGYDCIGESFCTYGACTCFHQMHSSNGLCVPRSQLNPVIPTKRCDSESYCIGGSRCQEGICRCGYDEVPDVNNKCVKKSSVYPIMKPTTTITPPTTTLRIPGLGESCIFSCTEGVCRGGICIDLEAEMERLELELKQNPAKSAVADVATNDRSTSEDLLLEGTHCAKDSDCPLSSRCLQGICFCNAGYRATAGYCEQISALGSSCISTNQCPLHAVCVQGTCQCASSLRDGKACRPPRLGRPGDQCHNDVICSYNSYCGLMSGVCECPSGMATERGECRQTALTTGKACVTSRNCHRFSYCDNGFCLCKSGYELVNDFCMPPPKRLLLNEIDEQPNQNLETQRNDGPQSPMQERIRTETFMQNMAGTNSIFGPVNSGDTSQSLTSNQLLSPNVLQPMTGTQSNMATLPIDLTKPPFNYSKNMNVQVFMATTSGPSTQTPATPFSSFNPIFAPNSFTPTFTPNMDNPFAAQFASFPIVNGAPIVSGDSSTASSSAINISPPKMRFAMPGEYCGDQALCLGNSFCTQDFCRCPDQCSAQNGICAYKYQDGIKVYDSDYLSKEDDDEAIDRKHLNASEERQFAQPLENCQNFEFCVGGSECLQLAAGLGLLCQCPVGLIYLQDECIEAPKAIDLVGIGEACGKNQLCLGGSICEDDKCVCRGGRRNILGICVYTAHPGDDCSNGQLCVDGSVCAGIKRTCICPPGKRSLLGRCVEQDGPEDEFAATMKEDGSENMIPHRHLTSAYPGENCSDSRTICMDNSKCANDLTCQCQPRFFNVDGRCVPSDMVRQPYESCSMTQICVTGSRCIEGFCQCADGLLGVDDRCIPVSNEIRRHELSKINSNSLTEVTNTPNGPICDENEDCPLHFRCHERLCVCHGSSSECLSIMLLSVDAQCSEDLQCPLNSKCNEGICICSDGYRMDADRCVVRHSQMAASPTLLHRLPMFAHEDPPADTSTLPSLPRIPTTPSSNQLPDNLVLNRIPSISVPTVTADPVMASRLLSSFLNALSQASESMRFSDAMLTTPAALPTLESIISSTSTMTVFSVPGQPCSVPNRICGNNGICFKDYCICSYDYIPINDSCIPRDGHIRFGHPCSDVHRCNEGLICLHDKCACSPEDITCDPNEPVTSPPGGSCTDARECTGGSVCREGWCICPDPSMIVQKGICIQSGIRPTLPPKTVPVYTTSIPTAPVYQTASVLSVTNKPAQPQVNTFNALPSTIHQGRKVTPGNQCGPLDSCVGGSMCLDGLCVCPQGTHASQNGRCESTTTTTQTTTKASTTWKPATRRPVDFIELPTHVPFVVDYNSNQRNNVPTSEYTSLSSGYNGHNVDRHYGRPSPNPTSASSSVASTYSTTAYASSTRPTTTSTPSYSGSKNECEAIGLYCRGNTICINKSCQCPDGHILHNDGCVPPSEAGKRKVRGKARHQAAVSSTTPGLAKPGEDCSDGQTCTGGSTCNDDWDCACPSHKPLIKDGTCVEEQKPQTRRQAVPGESCDANTDCINGSSCHSGQCRCAPQFVALSGFCVQMPMSTTPQMKTFAKPLESCENGETCEGGSKCDDDTLICMCPRGQVAFGVECKVPPGASVSQMTTQETISNPATTECENDNNCGEGKLCVAGRCRCRPGTVDNAGVCELLEEIEIGERPIPISYARHRVLSEKQKPASGHAEPEIQQSQSSMSSEYENQRVIQSTTLTPLVTVAARAPARAEGQKPRVVGPPIRRPKPKPKTTSSSGSGSGTGSVASYKTGGSGNGNCPPALRPKQLKYGQPCDVYKDRCTNAAKCIDNVCKCPPGLYLNTTGWCEFVDYEKLKSHTKLPNLRTQRPFASTASTPSWPKIGKPTSPPFFGSIVKGVGHKSEDSDEVRHSRPIYERPYAPGVTTRKATIPTTSTIPPTAARTTPTTTTTTTTVSVAAIDHMTITTKKVSPRVRGRKPGSTCRGGDICMNGSACENGRCQCPSHLVIKNGKCLKPVKDNIAHPGNTCENGEQCIGGSICDSDVKICICAARHIIVNGVCKSKDGASFVYPDSPCDSGQICSGGSICVDGICQCDSNHYIEDGYCRHITSRSSQVKHEAGGALRFSSKSFQPRSMAAPCNVHACQLPDCFCSPNGRRSPLRDSPIHEVPQFVVLTFDDAVNGRTLPDYKELFENTKFNTPNGCPIKATFFISHEWTNYDGVQWLSDRGMELASNSISHVSLSGENASRWLNEIDGQRRIMAKFSNSLEEEIIGMRAPQLSAGGNEQFEMMARAGFIYDNTLSANPGVNGEPYWPQTLDYLVPWNCHEENCPTSSFPGIWEVPLNQFYGIYLNQIDSYRRSSMVRAAVDLNNTVDELTSMLLRNFDRAYTSNRAPYVLSLNADFLQLNGKNTGMVALNNFLQIITQNKDVFVVNMKQLIDWMKHPLPLSQIYRSEALRCPTATQFSQNPQGMRTNSCTKPNKCMYRTPTMNSQEHQFLTCSPCPELYPWLENPIGKSPY